MNTSTKVAPETTRVLFIEFATSEHYEGFRPSAFVTSDDRRYDVDYDPKDKVLIYHQCASGQCYPTCYLENAEHKYWAGEGITVVTSSGESASRWNRIELPQEYREYWEDNFYEWPDMVEGT